MRRLTVAILTLSLVAIAAAPAEAGKRKHKKLSGIEGVVRNSTCYGPCIEPQATEPVYPGPVTITVRRASDGVPVASQAISDGKFRIRLKRGLYEVSSVPPNPPSCEPQPDVVCPAEGSSPAVIMPCLVGETKRVQVRRHRFTHVELHVTNVCVV